DISRTIVLQSLLQSASLSFAKPKFDDLRKKATQERLENAVPLVTAALSNAAKFLNGTIGFKTGRLLPYALQLLLLAVFFGERPLEYEDLNDKVRKVLSKWFWATSYSGFFAS